MISVIGLITIEWIRKKYYKLQLQLYFRDRIDSSLKVFIVTMYLVRVASEEENTCNSIEVFEEVTTQMRY